MANNYPAFYFMPLQKDFFMSQFFEVFSKDTGFRVSPNDTPLGLDLDSLDLIELGLYIEDRFNLVNIDELDLVSYMGKPLQALCDATYEYYLKCIQKT